MDGMKAQNDSSEGCVDRSSSEGMSGILSAENILPPSSCLYSSCPSRTAPTRRVIAVSLGKIPTTRIRRLISSFDLQAKTADIHPAANGLAELRSLYLQDIKSARPVITRRFTSERPGLLSSRNIHTSKCKRSENRINQTFGA